MTQGPWQTQAIPSPSPPLGAPRDGPACPVGEGLSKTSPACPVEVKGEELKKKQTAKENKDNIILLTRVATKLEAVETNLSRLDTRVDDRTAEISAQIAEIRKTLEQRIK